MFDATGQNVELFDAEWEKARCDKKESDTDNITSRLV